MRHDASAANIAYFFGKRKDISFKDTQRKKRPPNKTLPLSKSMNIDIFVVVTSNQLFIRDP